MSRTSKSINMTRLAQAEVEFLAGRFLAPVLPGRGVVLGAAGVRLTLAVLPADFRGWGIFRPLSHACAQAVDIPTLEERRAYLDRLPAARVIILSRSGGAVSALAANDADTRFDTSAAMELHLAFAGEVFDQVIARVDDGDFLFDRLDTAVDPGMSAYLRRQLARKTPPRQLAYSGLTKAHRQAYTRALDRAKQRRT